jgi:hypothetical protein
MNGTRTYQFTIPLLLLMSTTPLYGQLDKKTAPSAANQPTAASQPTAATLQGLSYERRDWDYELGAPPIGTDYSLLCYTLAAVNSATQPFILRPVNGIYQAGGTKLVQIEIKKGKTTSKQPISCQKVDNDHPLKMDTQLVIAIDARQVDRSRFRLLNINVTTSAGLPLSPTPIRPSFGATSAATSLEDGVYYLAWPIKLAGDVIPTVTISVVYSPPVPGNAWLPHTSYPPGSIVSPPQTNGHYYMTSSGGISGPIGPASWSTLPETPDNTCSWLPAGVSSPSQGSVLFWGPSLPFSTGAIVYVPTAQLFYVQTKGDTNNKCQSGTLFPFTVAREDIQELTGADAKTKDGSVQWQFVPDVSIDCPAHKWQPEHPYNINDQVCDPETGNRVYQVVVGGTSGKAEAKVPFIYPSNGQRPTWTDIGEYPPALATGTYPADQVVTLINLQLPQVHTLSYYNLASGVLVSTIRTKTFGFSTSPSTNNGTPIQTGSNLIVDPVITLTRYIWPFDAERKEHWGDWKPGVSISFSLSSPTSNFYFGGSSEVLRYIQLEYGFALAKVPHLATGTYAPSSLTTPNTVQSFAKGGYIGLSFNITGLIQGLIGSASGKGSSSGSSPSGSSN